MKFNWKLIGEWTHRILALIIFNSCITILSWVGIIYTMDYFMSRDIYDGHIMLSLINFAFASAYLQIANALYWLADINIFDFKSWRKGK